MKNCDSRNGPKQLPPNPNNKSGHCMQTRGTVVGVMGTQPLAEESPKHVSWSPKQQNGTRILSRLKLSLTCFLKRVLLAQLIWSLLLYPFQTPLLSHINNYPWHRWFGDLVSLSVALFGHHSAVYMEILSTTSLSLIHPLAPGHLHWRWTSLLEFFRHSVILWRRLSSWEYSLHWLSREEGKVLCQKVHMQ